MTLRDTLAKLNRLQQGMMFKIIASALVVAIAGALVVTYAVRQNAASQQANRLHIMTPEAAPEGSSPKETEAEKAAREEMLRAATTQVRLYNRLIDQQFSTGTVAIGIGAALLPVLAAIWLGVGLTYLGLALLGAAVSWPMIRFGSDTWRGVGYFFAGVLCLAASFSALVQLLRLLLSPSHPITAIARNVVAEAVRMKISLVFIVLLIIGLAALPGLLDPTTPLRYRVQSFLQYGATGTFWLTGILVVFLSAATVAFEQRDRIIWQTMTKPVRSWQYVWGKWLGVVGVGAVLLGVSCSGVFLFTEYLRRTQPAIDEIRPYVSARGEGTISEDRLVLESQVLVGRRSVRPVIPAGMAAEIEDGIKSRKEEEARLYRQDPRQFEAPNEGKIRRTVETEKLDEFLGIKPAGMKQYEFRGLEAAKDFDLPLTLRYKVHSGSDAPTEFVSISLFIEGSPPLVRSTPLGQVLTMPLSSAAIKALKDEAGNTHESLVMTIVNGDVVKDMPNDKSISFAPDGLEISYAVSTFQANFLRVAVVMWLKLAFLAMVAIATSTFLAFPVACMVSFGTFLLAEGAKALSTSLDYFNPAADEKNTQWAYDIVLYVARPLTWMFQFYSDLDPTNDLVEGKLVSWGAVSGGVITLGVLTLLLGLIGSMIFKGRELATYSGQ